MTEKIYVPKNIGRKALIKMIESRLQRPDIDAREFHPLARLLIELTKRRRRRKPLVAKPAPPPPVLVCDKESVFAHVREIEAAKRKIANEPDPDLAATG